MRKAFDKYYKLLEKVIKYYLIPEKKVVIDTIPGIKDIYDYLIPQKVKIDKTATSQSQTSVGISEAKKDDKTAMINFLMIIVSASIALFKKTNDKENLEKVNYVMSDFTHMSDSDLALKAQEIYDLMETKTTDLAPWLIDANDFVVLQDSIDTFNAIKTSPTEQIEHRKGDTKLLEKQLIDEANKKIREELDQSFEAIRLKKPGLYYGYIRINVLDERGLINHVGLQVTAKDENTKLPIKNATLFVEQPFINDTEKTDKDGVVYMDLIATGDYVGILKAEGYNDYTFDFHINRLKRTSLEILMTKTVPTT